MKINRVLIKGETLKKLGLEKGTDIVKLSIALTDLSTFSKLNTSFAHETSMMKEKFKDNPDTFDVLAVSNFSTMTTLQFILVGKTIEAWALISEHEKKKNSHPTDGRIHRSYFEKLDEEGQELFEKLKKYFGGTAEGSNLKKLKRIRNKIAFHYDKDFDLFFTDNENKPDFPEVRLYSNWECGGTGFLSDIYHGIVAGGFKMKEGDFDWLKLFEEFKQYLASLEIIIYKYIFTILDDSIIYNKEMDIPNLKTGDTILNNHFWELPLMEDPPS